MFTIPFADFALMGLDNSESSPALRNVAAHWFAACQQRKMPGWSAIRPVAIAAQLPIVWSYSYDKKADTFTGRLAGSKIAQVFGSNFHGVEMSAVKPVADFAKLFSLCKRVISEPAIYYGVGILFRQPDQVGFGERIILPLASDGVEPDGIFGATDFVLAHGAIKGFTGETPAWFPL